MSELEFALPEIIKGLKSSLGEEYFYQITLQLDNIIGSDYTFIASLDMAQRTAKTISLVANGEVVDNFEYELEGAPCARVVNDSVFIYPEKICSFFPKDQMLVDMGIEGYVGVCLHNSCDEPIGVVVALYKAKIENPEFAKALFELFSGRIAAEMERTEQKRDLERLNHELEIKVNALIESESKLCLHLQNTPLGCISWDANFHCTEWNKSAELMFGYTAEEAIGRHAYDLIVHDESKDTADELYKLLFKQKGGTRSTNENKTKDGRIIKCDWYNTSIINTNNTVVGIASLVQDVTERADELIRINQELAFQNQEKDKRAAELVIASQAKSEFLSSMSHELRTPMNAILGFAQLLKLKSRQPLTESQQNYVEHILTGGNHLLALIDQVLDLEKIEAGSLSLSLEPIRLTDVCQECLDLISTQENKLNLSIKSNLVDTYIIEADYTRIKQIILNLLSNAVKYNRENGLVTLSCTEAPDKMIRVSITDTGSGIADDDLGRLYEPFDRLSHQHGAIEGAGVGLSISKKLIEAMNGRIGVESKAGKGSTFWLEMPGVKIDDKDKAAAVESLNTAVAEHQPQTVATILYIEDSQPNLKLMEGIIGSMEGLTLISSPSAELGIVMAKERRPDLILMDIHLPGLDGITATQMLSMMDITKNIPVIAISAAAMTGDIKKAKAAGFKAYLTKPIDIHKAIDAINKELKI